MRFAPLAVLLALAACGGGKASPERPDAPAVAAVRDRSAKAHAAAMPMETGIAKDEPVKNEVQDRRAKVVGKDPDGCTWLESTASVAVGARDSRHQARAAAMEQARAAAIQDFLGVEVKSKFMDFQQEGLRKQSRLTEGILQTTRSGRIAKEQVLEEGYRDAPDCPACLYRMTLKACVTPRESGADKDFSVALAVSSPRYFNGDQAYFTVTATRDCWVYVYTVYDLGSLDLTGLIIPNGLYAEKKLKAGETWLYPTKADRENGASLTATLPNPEEDVSAETIRVVAAKAALPHAVYGPEDGGYLGVLKRLERSHVEWAEDADAYVIYKK
jgi:hypothetical protein